MTEMGNSKNDQKLMVDKRPGVLIVGSPNVGKRTLISRLLSVDIEDASDSLSEAQAYGWTINTKYYTADVAVWMVHLHDELALGTVPNFDRLAALVMVFDMSELSSLAAIKDWVSRTNIQKFDILLCIGNKVDLLPGHEAHVEYKRRLQKKLGQSSTDPYQDSSEYGISETEGTSLLGGDDSSWETKQSCQEWCIEHNIEYLEACASNADFDKCLSVDGDSQGVERLFGALSAHMWPGMILKSGDKINEPSLPDAQELSDEDSDYELEYEILSGGSAEPWDDTDGVWISAKDSDAGASVVHNTNSKKCDNGTENISVEEQQQLPSTSVSSHLQTADIEDKEIPDEHEAEKPSKPDEAPHYDFEDLEKLMSEIGNMRDNLRLMPDFQRRDMAAKVAMKMAAMFGDCSSGDESS